MKLQKRFLRKHKNNNYYKYIVNIPPMMIKEAGLKEGDDLEISIKKDKMTFKKKDNSKKKPAGEQKSL